MSDAANRPSSTGITRLHAPQARPSFMKDDGGRPDLVFVTKVPSTPSVEPESLEVESLEYSSDKFGSSRDIDHSLGLLQMRIRHDLREEMKPLLVISEELRTLSSQILSSQVAHVTHVTSDFQETGYRPNRREPGMRERLERNPTINTDWFIPREGSPKGGGRSSMFRDLDDDTNNSNSNNNGNNNCNGLLDDMAKDPSSLSPRAQGAGKLRGTARVAASLPGSVDSAREEETVDELPSVKAHSSRPVRRTGTSSRLGGDRPGVTIYNADSEGGHSLKAKTRTFSFKSELPSERQLQRFVRGPSFDYISGALVLLNAITLGLQTDWQARNVTSQTPPVFRVIEVFFCIAFTLEVALRILGYRWEFFARQHILWHLFDCFLVATQLLEEVMRLLVPADDDSEGGSSSSSSVTSNLSVLRVVRILRLIRVMRLMRILRLIGELRTLVSSIVGSLRSLIWAVALLFLMMYVMGVYLTQLILDHRLLHEAESGDEDMLLLVHHYGSLGDTVLSVYMSIFGGVDWGDILSPLRTQISVFLVPFFMFYIAFATLCMLNVITGVFVESALLTAKQDQDSYMLGTVQMVFDSYDLDKNGRMSFPEFQKSLDSMDMRQVLAQLQIDPSQAPILFQLLDKDEEGSISAKDFVLGCARLKGPAKALDLAVLMHESDHQRAEILGKVDELHTRVGRVLKLQDGSSWAAGRQSRDLRKAPILEEDMAAQARMLEAVLIPSGSKGQEEDFQEV